MSEIQIINKGTGAGGAKTNLNGKKFEEKTDNSKRLIEIGFTPHIISKKSKKLYDYLSKTFEDREIIFLLQNNFKKYIKYHYNIDLFRYPDEAYIIKFHNGKTLIKILEKKEQYVEGSVETKLWSGPSLKREYELVLGEYFEVSYGFCLNNFLKLKLTSIKKKYIILNTILKENSIAVLFGDEENYFETLDEWIH